MDYMTHEEKYEVFKKEFSILGLSYNELQVLYNLVGYVHLKVKEKNKDATLEETCSKLFTGTAGALDTFFTPIFIMHLRVKLEHQDFKPSALNFKSVTDIKTEIFNTVNNWLPF